MDHQPVVFTNALLLCPAQVGKFLSFIIFVINVFEREGKGMKGKISLDSFSTPGGLLCSSSPTLEKGSSWIPTLPSKGQGNLASGWPTCMLVSGFCSGVHEVNKLASKRGSAISGAISSVSFTPALWHAGIRSSQGHLSFSIFFSEACFSLFRPHTTKVACLKLIYLGLYGSLTCLCSESACVHECMFVCICSL